MASTRYDHRHAAEICRDHGWGVGTCLVGDAGFGPTVIQITALGDKVMLAKIIRQGCASIGYHDAQAWSLSLREWHPLG